MKSLHIIYLTNIYSFTLFGKYKKNLRKLQVIYEKSDIHKACY